MKYLDSLVVQLLLSSNFLQQGFHQLLRRVALHAVEAHLCVGQRFGSKKIACLFSHLLNPIFFFACSFLSLLHDFLFTPSSSLLSFSQFCLLLYVVFVVLCFFGFLFCFFFRFLFVCGTLRLGGFSRARVSELSLGRFLAGSSACALAWSSPMGPRPVPGKKRFERRGGLGGALLDDDELALKIN